MEQCPGTNKCLRSKLAYMLFYSNEGKICLRQEGSRYTVVTNSPKSQWLKPEYFLLTLISTSRQQGALVITGSRLRSSYHLSSRHSLLEGQESSESHFGNEVLGLEVPDVNSAHKLGVRMNVEPHARRPGSASLPCGWIWLEITG